MVDIFFLCLHNILYIDGQANILAQYALYLNFNLYKN